ncbi:TauD/TfdA family dioxygenase [Comamonadaceae bacterium G21597-S1]|nr:TauD/TfdA family dioxygenase [Comamonadaceae bacterium G21597-S1]
MNFRHIDVQPLTPTIGAEISGVDLNGERSEDVYEEIRQALWKHHVVLLRKQALTPEAYLRLGSVFGTMHGHEMIQHVPNFPQIQLLDHRGYERPETDRWHADVTFRKRPTLVNILRLVEVPAQGGDTMWMNAAAAFEALDEPVRNMLLQMNGEHDIIWSHLTFNFHEYLIKHAVAAGKTPPTVNELIAHEAKIHTPVVHPAVIRHPITGRHTLYVNSVFTKCLAGIHPDISQRLLAMLSEWVKKPEFGVRFKWEPDSIAIWDNAATQHYAVFDYAPHYRAGHRLTCGDFEPSA